MIIEYTLYRIYDVFKMWRSRELLNPKSGWFRARVIHMPRIVSLSICLSIHDPQVRLAVYYFEEEQREYTRAWTFRNRGKRRCLRLVEKDIRNMNWKALSKRFCQINLYFGLFL